ncbi:MAG: DUF6157 family protein [Cyclobacteriaceae bacterium]
MKVHTTNYNNTFITVAEDCTAEMGVEPPLKGEKQSIANLQFELLKKSPYKYTSDDLLFKVYAIRNDLVQSELKAERENYFSKGQACMRASPLTKTYGWGVHNDENGKIAIYGRDSREYEKLSKKKTLKVVPAMRSKRKEK